MRRLRIVNASWVGTAATRRDAHRRTSSLGLTHVEDLTIQAPSFETSARASEVAYQVPPGSARFATS